MRLEIFRAVAAASNIVGGGVEKVDDGSMDVGNLVATIIKIALWITGVLAVAFIIYGGVKYVMSQGDSGKTTTARNTIIYAAIGLIVAILAYAIVKIVIGEFGGKKGADSSKNEDEEKKA